MEVNDRIGNWMATRKSTHPDHSNYNEFVFVRYGVPDKHIVATTGDGETFYVSVCNNSGLYGSPISYKLTREMFLEYPKEGTDYSKYKR